MTVQEDVVVKKALTPFDDEDADTILRSSDGVDFHVYRIILSLGSPFFKTMFTLKQPLDPGATIQKPFVEMQEHSGTIDKLLRFCYPIPDPSIQSMTDLGDVLEAAMKYEMEQPTILMKGLLRTGMTEDPLQAFAVACRLRMEPEAMAAATAWNIACRSSFIPDHPNGFESVDWKYTPAGQAYVEPMSQISAGAYFRLLQFMKGKEVSRFCEPPKHCRSPSEGATLQTTQPTPIPHPDGQPADMIIRSSDGVDFPVHRLLISFASSLLKKGKSLPPKANNLPVFVVEEHSEVLDVAIQLCYPIKDPTLPREQVLIHLLRFSVMHNAQRAKDFVQRNITLLSDLHPLRMFFIVAQQGWQAEARTAISRLLHTHIQSLYVSEMEEVSAKVYREFLQFYHEISKQIVELSYQSTGNTTLLPKFDYPSRPSSGYAHVAPMMYGPIASRAVDILKLNPYNVSPNADGMMIDSIQIMHASENLLNEVCNAHSSS